jgi:hexosaminidase
MYPIVPTLVDPGSRATNYNVTIVNGTLSIGTIVMWTNPASISYGTALGGGQLNASANVPGNFVYTPPAGTVLDVGAYTLTAVFTPNDTTNYQSATNTVSLTVTNAPLTVTATSATRPAGTTNPVFTGIITGLQNGDNITATYGTSATSVSPPGTYPIVPTLVDPGNRLTNYSVSLVNGSLVITPAQSPITVGTPNIIPLPVTLQNRPGTFTLCPSQPTMPAPGNAAMQILVDGASQPTGQYLAQALAKSTGYQFQLANSTATNAVKNAILITTSNALSNLGTEGYELTVAPDSVVIRAPAQGGTFYGVQSLLQLLPPKIYSPRIATNVAWVAPCVYIQDYPLFSWRGVMLDVARHFANKDEVKQVLDAMAMHKLNTFHWHLVDDQGWRLEITNYPNLTSLGAWRNGTDYGLPPRATTATNGAGQYGGFYTQADARDIVAYAAERHITVVPEIEMPCHSDAGLYAYGQFSCGHEGAYTMDYYGIQSLYGIDLYSLGRTGTMDFLRDVVTEMMAIFPGKYIHCGGDEVIASGDKEWNTYSADVTNMMALGITPNGNTSIIQYQHWFSTNMSAFIQANGRMMMGWSEYEAGGVVPNAAVMDWQTGSSSQAGLVASNNLPVVMSPDTTCYINYVEGNSANLPIDPPFVVGGTPSYLSLSTVYGFNPIPSGLAAQYQTNILGAQCNLWGEYVPSFYNMMLKMWPRETAMAEITWTPRAQQSFSNFTNRLAVQKQRFTAMGLNYDHESIPTIGTWSNVGTGGATLNFDITTNVTAAGEIDISFWYLSGSPLNISSVALLVNGTQVDIDTHSGTAGANASNYQTTEPFIPIYTLYIVRLPEFKPGATYTIRAAVAGSGGTATSGTVYMPNWD